MSAVSKIAVSLPKHVFRELEKKRKVLKRTRSALVTDAITAYLEMGGLTEEERRYLVSYLKDPETTISARAMVKTSSWGAWDEAK